MTQRDVVFPPGRQALYEHNRYSPAIRANGLLFVSGQVGSREDGSPEPELEAQVRRAFDNLNAILEAAGCTFEDVIDVTVFMVDRAGNLRAGLEPGGVRVLGAGTASDGYRRGRDLALWLSVRDQGHRQAARCGLSGRDVQPSKATVLICAHSCWPGAIAS